MSVEERLEALGIDLHDYFREGYYGTSKGSLKAHHQVGNILFLSRHIPEVGDKLVHPGTLGSNVTVEQGYQAARVAAINCLAGIKRAIGDLENIVSIIRSLNFVVCTPDFHEVHKVANGATDLFVEVLGEEKGLGARATIGVTSLSGGHCFENWLTVEVL